MHTGVSRVGIGRGRASLLKVPKPRRPLSLEQRFDMLKKYQINLL